MQKATLWILGLVIIIGGWYLWTQMGTSAPSENTDVFAQETADADIGVQAGNASPAVPSASSNANVPATVITFTDAGFNPSSITIKKGQTVRWMNNSGSKVWPASAVHPQHSAYPQKSASDCLGSSFDACRALSQGESWDFTFTYVGNWKFHDHLHSSNTGVVNVTE